MASALSGGFNVKSPTVKRILQESKELSRNPEPSFRAGPLEDNLYEWHFTLRGPPKSAYERGLYHGRIILPPTYPLRPPTFKFLTPTGRFEVNREICLSISGHHEETWQPAWGIRTALCAIRAFMESDANGQVGGIDCTEAARRRMALESHAWRCPSSCYGGQPLEEAMRDWEKLAEATQSKANGADGAKAASTASQVPAELRLAYKDELGGKEKAKEKEPEKATSSVNGATGTTRTSEKSSAAQNVSSSSTGSAVASTAARAAGSQNVVPTPTETVRRTQPLPNDGVPAWIDKAIFLVALILVFMMVKKIVA